MQDTMDQAQEKVRAAGGAAKDFVRNQVDVGTDRVGQQLKDTAADMRSASGHLRDRGNSTAADLVDTIANRTEQFGDYLLEADAQQLMDDVQQFTRDRPWIIASAGLVVGFAAARLIKTANGDYTAGNGGYDATRYGSAGLDQGPLTAYGSP